MPNDTAACSHGELCQHPDTCQSKPREEEADKFYKITRYFKAFDRVKVQVSSQMSRGILSPAIQLFKVTNQIHVCVEHRSSPTACFAKRPHQRLADAKFSDIKQYVRLWKPVLMMEIVTSAVRDDHVITLFNLRVSLTQDLEGRYFSRILSYQIY